MARPRATNDDDKRKVILDRSAELFAEYGYDRASTNRIAEAVAGLAGNLGANPRTR